MRSFVVGRRRLVGLVALCGLIAWPCLPSAAEAGRPGAAVTWRPLPLGAWLGPLVPTAQAAALAGRVVAGRDGVVRWRPLPAGLAAEAMSRPVRLQALVERAASGVVLARSTLCLTASRVVRLRVVSAAAVQLAVDQAIVLRLRPWFALRPTAPSVPHEVTLPLTAGCHVVRVALRSPRGRLTLALAWTIAAGSWRATSAPVAQALRAATDSTRAGGHRQRRPPRRRVAALGWLVDWVRRGGARGPRYAAVRAALAAGRMSHPGAALRTAMAAVESGDRIARLRRALVRWQRDVPLGLALVQQLDESGRPHEALRVWNAQLAGAELRDPTACAVRALLWQRLDVSRAAKSLATACARRFPADRAGPEAVARLAAATDDLVGAAAARVALLRQAPADAERWLDVLGAFADLAEGAELPNGLTATLSGALRTAPAGAQAWDHARARNSLGLAWLHRAQPKRAERLLRGVPPWARRAVTLELLGRALLAQSGPGAAQRRSEALGLLREAMRRAPGRADLRARVALLAPAQRFYRPHQRDLLRLARRATTQPNKPLAVPFAQLLRQTVVRQLAPGRLARYEVAVWQVGVGGPTSHDLEIDYVPSQATPEVLQAAIVGVDGHVRRGVPQRLETLSEDSDGLYYDLERITLTFSGLRPGDVLISAYTVRDFAPDPFGLVFGELFQLGAAWPVRETDIVLELDPKLRPKSAWRHPAVGRTATLRRAVLRDEGLVGGEGVTKRRWRRWRLRVGPLAGVAVESQMPGASEVVDTLHVSTFASWTEAARWYATFVADALPRVGTDAELTRLAQRLTAGLTTPRAKVAAMYRWVADEIRYVGLEFGIHSLKPHAVREVLARRFGDCKDKATVLVALLAEIGVSAQVALVRTADSGKLRDGVASLGGFSHAIAWVPSLGWWLDATVQFHEPTELPVGDVGGQALAIPRAASAAARLVDLPDAGPAANRRIERCAVRLAADGGAMLALTVRAHGLPAAALRERLHDPVSRVERSQADLSGRFPGLHVLSVVVEGVQPAAAEVVVRIRARVPRLVKGGADGWTWQPLAPESAWRKRASAATVRTHPYVGAYAWRDERHVVVTPPKGRRLQARVGARLVRGGLGRFEVEVVDEGAGSWRFSRTVERSVRVLPASGHSALVRWLTRLDVALAQELHILVEPRP